MEPILNVSSLVSIIGLSAKFENLRCLVDDCQRGEPDDELRAQVAARLDLWSADICKDSRGQNVTPRHVLQVLEDAKPDSSLVNAIRADFDQLESTIAKHPTDSKWADKSIADCFQHIYHLSDSVKDIRNAYAAATRPKEQPPSVILSFDGGGIRSYSSILIMQDLMHKVTFLQNENRQYAQSVTEGPSSMSPETSPELLPRDFFDYIFGTSSGGLLAIMLGRLRMPLSDCRDAFKRYSEKVFDHPRLLSSFTLFGPRYNTKRITAAIRELVEEKQLDLSRPWKQNVFASEGDPCRTGVFSLRHNLSNDIERVHLFRSYDSPSRPHTLNTRQAAAAEPTWAIARATSAAPTYFAPMRINNDHYFDAGTSGLNNPSVDALLEVMYMPTNMTKSSLEEGSKAHSESPARTAIATQPQVSLLISIGTGERNKPSRFSRSTSFSILSIIRLLKYALSSMTATEDQHLHAKHICLISGIKYYRFNVAEGLEHISLDDNRHINFLDRMRGNKTKRTLEEIEEVTARYLKRPVVEQQLWKAAKDLIAARRTRVPPPIEPLPDLRTSMSSTENTLLGNSRVRTK